MSLIRLDKFLADNGIGTRSQVREQIKKGLVKVNNDTAKKADLKIDTQKDEVLFNGDKIEYQRYHYYILNKPKGCITATTDTKDKTVMDILKDVPYKNMFPVGRLDKDTEGLLLITDDGDLAHRLLAPKNHIDKTYFVRCSGIISNEDIDVLEKGVDIGDDKPTMPAKAVLMSSDEEKNTSELLLTIREGRFHQVKRMIKAVGKTVIYLERVSFGSIKLDDSIKRGKYRRLGESEIEELKSLESLELKSFSLQD